MKAILHFWQTRDKTCLELYVPSSIYDEIDTSGRFIDGVNKVFSHFMEQGISITGDLLNLSEEEIKSLVEDIPHVPDIDRQRVELAIALYKLLHQKYSFDYIELGGYIAQLRTEALPDFSRAEQALAEPDLTRKLFMLLDYMEKLKKDMVLLKLEYTKK